jgi:hypothetical protein
MYRLAYFTYCFCLMITIVSAQNAAIVTSIIVDDNNVSGGGFQSDVTITEDGMTVYSAADVSGIFKSTNGGLSYVNINQGLHSPKVATLAITADNEQILYAGTGDKGNNGGLFRSIDGGDTWEITNKGDSAFFAGNHSADSDSLPYGNHPRSNGDLIAIVHGPILDTFTDDIVIAGTYKSGVKIFTDGGDQLATFAAQEIIDTEGFVRSVAYDPSIPNTAFAAIQFIDTLQSGIYKIDFSNTDSITSEFVYQAFRPEGLVVLGSGHVYGAIGSEGIVKYNGISWKSVNNNLGTFPPNDTLNQWTAVTGYVKNGNTDIVYATVNNRLGSNAGPNFSSVWRSKNGGSLWEPLVDYNTNISHQIFGQTYDWWYSREGFPAASLGRGNNVISSIEVARGVFPDFVTDDIIYVSGRGGIWKSEDGGSNWNPAVYNMQATANNDVAVNPNNPAQVVIGNTDYVVLETSNYFSGNHISKDKPAGAESRGHDVIFDATSNNIIVGVGDRDRNEGGEVFLKSADDLGDSSEAWLNTQLINATEDEGKVRAVSYGYHDGVEALDEAIILAAVEGDGVYSHEDESWSKSNGVDIRATKRSNFIWPDNGNSGVVYLLDLLEGLYRSQDGGKNWTNIWPDMSFNNRDFFNTGYITADDKDPTTLYVSIQGKTGSAIGTGFRVFRMEGANQGIFGEPGIDTNIVDISHYTGDLDIKRPGPIDMGPDGKLWLTQQQDSKNSVYAELFVMEDPKNDLLFTKVSNNDYRNLAIQPSGMDVSNDGHVYIAQNGTGLVKIKYTDTTNVGLSDDCIEIYPDPIHSIFTITGTLSAYDIEIIDANGIVHTTLDNSGTTVLIDMSDLPIGTFLVRAINQVTGALHIQKILKF